MGGVPKGILSDPRAYRKRIEKSRGDLNRIKELNIKEAKELQDEELNDYEQKRLQNIADRKSKILELKIVEKRSELSEAEKARRKQMQKEKLPSGPPRKSARKQNLDPDTGLKIEPIHSFTNKNCSSKDPLLSRNNPMSPEYISPILECHPQREYEFNLGDHHFVFGDDSPRMPLEDLRLEDLCQFSNVASNYFNFKIKQILHQDVKPVLNGHLKIKELNSIFENHEALEENLESLKITDETIAQVVPFGVFSLAIHPTESKLLIAAGDKWGSIGFWDVYERKLETKGIQVIKSHSRPINCLTYDLFDNSKVVSTSYDGTVRIFDINETKSSMLYAGQDDKYSYTTYHAQVDRDCYLVTLGRPGLICLVDRRASNLEAVSKMKICDVVSPKVVSVHPTKGNLFLAPIDQGCGIFDFRNEDRKCNGDQEVSSIKPLIKLETKRLMPTWMAKGPAAITSASFSPLTGNKVVTIAYDNSIKLFDTSDENVAKNHGTKLKPYQTVDHYTKTNKTIVPIKAEWHPRFDDLFFVGSSYHDLYTDGRAKSNRKMHGIDVVSDQGNSFTLSSQQLKSLCSIVKCHPTQDIIAGADSHGKIHVFMA